MTNDDLQTLAKIMIAASDTSPDTTRRQAWHQLKHQLNEAFPGFRDELVKQWHSYNNVPVPTHEWTNVTITRDNILNDLTIQLAADNKLEWSWHKAI